MSGQWDVHTYVDGTADVIGQSNGPNMTLHHIRNGIVVLKVPYHKRWGSRMGDRIGVPATLLVFQVVGKPKQITKPKEGFATECLELVRVPISSGSWATDMNLAWLEGAARGNGNLHR